MEGKRGTRGNYFLLGNLLRGTLSGKLKEPNTSKSKDERCFNVGTESENETHIFLCSCICDACIQAPATSTHLGLKYLITHIVIVQAQHLHTDIQGRQRGRKYPHNDVLFPIEI